MFTISTYFTFQPRMAPPTYEEALSTQAAASLRLNLRSLSHDEASAAAHSSPPPPFRGRPMERGGGPSHQQQLSSSMPTPRRNLVRSTRVEEIPDIYWEQAARELDFCTCRKCQVSQAFPLSVFWLWAATNCSQKLNFLKFH